VIEGKAVEDKIRRREENPDAAVEAAAAARNITVYFNSDVAGGRGGGWVGWRAGLVCAQMLKQGEQGSGASGRMAVWLIAGSSLWPDLWPLQMACPGGLCPPSGA
jgi:hypothetical protein